MRANPSRFARVIPAALLLLIAAVAPALARRLDVEVWTDRGGDAVYEPGDPMRVKVRTTDDAYLLVYELDSEGHVNLLYPWNRGAGRIEARRTLRIPEDASNYQLVVEQKTGQGFIVAIASDRPFRDLPWYLRPFDPQAAAIGYDRDDRSRDAGDRGSDADDDNFDDQGRVMGDPYVAMERIRRRVMDRPADVETFASSYASYYVHEQVRYPRYLCNDCHRPNRWAWWDGFDPYYAHCSVIDFRVNWSWCWGPQMWTSYLPYYYYTVRSDCPPRYQPWYDSRTRFSSWDGWNRWGELWGGQLRRYKPMPAPVSYVPPPPRGAIWRQGQTPPGFVPPDVRRQSNTPGSNPAGWLQRDRGDGKPVWREGPRVRPDGPGAGGGSGGSGGSQRDDNSGKPAWRDGGRLRGNTPPPSPPSDGSGTREDRPVWRGGDSPRNNPPRQDPPWQDPPRQDPPRQDPPRQDPPRDNPPPMWKQPPPEPPKWAPQPPKQEPPKGHGGKGKG